jgi:hypothetical protein
VRNIFNLPSEIVLFLKIGVSLAKVWRKLDPILFYSLIEVILPANPDRVVFDKDQIN